MMRLDVNFPSENSLFFTFAAPETLEKQQRVWALAAFARKLPKVSEVICGMNNFTVFFELDAAYQETVAAIESAVLAQAQNQQQTAGDSGKLVEIPVIYDGEDLADVAKYHGITPDEVIARHTAPVYTVFMMGFMAGFPYLGGLPENLATPRKDKPRTRVPAGSVGIGGSQTGVYPFTSPGGWQLIGRTDLPLFDITRENPVLLQAGDSVRFVAVHQL